MPLAVNNVTGTSGSSSAGTVTSSAITTVSGSDIIVIGHDFGATAANNGDITDSKLNTYTLLASNIGGAGVIGCAVWHVNTSSRGSSHTFTYNPTAGSGGETLNIAVIEITGQNGASDWDSTTVGTATDSTTPFTVTAGAAIAGNQIAIYVVTLDASVNNAWTTNPAGYTQIYAEPNGANLVSLASYKINETGTPSIGAARVDTDTTGGREIFTTFKELISATLPRPILVELQAVKMSIQ